MAATKSYSVDMTHGGLAGKIIIFALPLIASGILQQSFNAVDVAMVGRFTGPEAMAAVGSNGVIISILVNLFLGIAVGANVVIANYIGMKNNNATARSVATVAVVSLLSGFILLIAGVTLARPILEAMSAPPDVIDGATLYLRIYFLGMPFIMVYNFGSAIMRSMGDTKRPFYALLAGAVVNAALDYIFVKYFSMGVSGVAIATVIANGVNAAIIVILLRREPEPFTLHLRRLSVSVPDLVKMLKIGVPAGLQGMVFSVSNIFTQTTINSFGSAAVAGSAAALTYESYCYYIISAFAASTIAFTGQNYGAGLLDRCRRVLWICMGLCVAVAGAANLIISFNSSWFLSVFTDNPDVIRYATERINSALRFQFIAASYEISGAYMRGLGYSMTPMLLTILGTCVLRVAWVYTVSARYHTFPALLLVYPVSWAVTGAMVMTAALIVARIIRHRHAGVMAAQ
ncbi:MAG: MATE family efflux transporter [Duncaniella sp.]|nr:MATE family efflux transporter [Duncaniella sp.]